MAPQAQRAMFVRDAGPLNPIKCPPPHCQELPKGKPAYRCVDCYHAPVVCEDCIVRDHLHNPFHRIEVWSDAMSFWERMSLSQLDGFVLNLGHAGEKCPSQDGLRTMTIVHEHGIIKMKVRLCDCIPKGDKFPIPEPIQLLHFGLFPGTWKAPRTAFTINGLRDYHLLSVQCQITGIDFATYLQRCTDNVLSKDVTERHWELNETMHNFMFLRSTRRAREEPKFDLDSGSLAVLCPACPQPHKNMDPEQYREKEDLYLDMLFYMIDGNFQASQKFKPMDSTDFPLTTGAAYYADEREYEIYHSQLGPRRKEVRRQHLLPNSADHDTFYYRTTCRKFGAMGYSRYKGRVSGVVSLSCAWHMFVIPCGTVDITGGESFAYPDYCMCAGLRPWSCLRRHHRGYDINCQYTVNLHDRIVDIRKKHPDLATISTRFPWTMVGIGKFHVAAHQESCRSRYSYYYLPGSAMTDGKAPKRIWSTLNHLSLRTKEMSSGHRHDVINDYHADMNTRRLHNMHNTLAGRLERAKVEEARTKEYLMELEMNVPADKLEEWRLEEGKWKENVEHLEQDGANFDSPYELKKGQDISQKDLLSSLVKKSGLTGESAVSLLDVIERGVELQQEREALLDVLDKDNRGNLREVTLRCEEFHAEVDRWQILQETYLAPLVEDASASLQATSIPPDFPFRDVSTDFRDVSTSLRESTDGLPRRRNGNGKTDSWKEVSEVFVPLPSLYHRAIRDHPSIRRLCALEYDFRQVAADRALGDVRASIISCEVIKMKKHDSHSKKTTERYDRRIMTANAEVANNADHYRRHWSALHVLGMPDSDPQFRRLKDADAVNIDLSTAQNLLGQSKRAVSWIWGDFSFVESKDDTRYQEFYDDARRVYWFRSSAVHAHWEEEVHLLVEEMRCTLRFHGYQRDQWNAYAREKDASQESGAAAYARK
ncbi:hypothetical protein LXA43DRAFT_899423 [Ganoderma leucocontextum]|nr:hypothetical protein LXA43DRAFT_899423 [Ganoderma leucocontextum]